MKALPGTVPTLAPWAWLALLADDPRVSGPTDHVACRLATHAQPGDRPVWPSAGTLARETGLSRQRVTIAVGDLRRLGYLTEADRRAYAAVVPELARADPRVKAYLLTGGYL